MILPILELSSIIYVAFALARAIFRRSASICAPHENPFSGVNADAEMIASSKLVLSKYAFATGEAVERFSFITCPPSMVTLRFFLPASSMATASPFVKMCRFLSGISFARYIAVVPPSIKSEQFSSMRLAAFCAISIFSSV